MYFCSVATVLALAFPSVTEASYRAERGCVALAIYYEARGIKSLWEQRAIAHVVLRRKQLGLWGHTTCSVVSAPRQFPWFRPHLKPDDPTALAKSKRIAAEVLAHPKRDPSHGADSFVLPTAPHPWTAGRRLVARGKHLFYQVYPSRRKA